MVFPVGMLPVIGSLGQSVSVLKTTDYEHLTRIYYETFKGTVNHFVKHTYLLSESELRQSISILCLCVKVQLKLTCIFQRVNWSIQLLLGGGSETKTKTIINVLSTNIYIKNSYAKVSKQPACMLAYMQL